MSNKVFLQILKVWDVELWQVKNNSESCRTRGALEVLYSQTLDLFILRIDKFKFALNKDLEVIATVGEKDHYYSYLLPTPDGFYMLKVIDSKPGPALPNFETILAHTTHFLRKTGADAAFRDGYEDEQGAFGKAKSSIKEGFMKTADAITKALAPGEKETHPNQRVVRSFEQLKDVSSPGAPVADVSEDDIQNACDETEEITRNHQNTLHWNTAKAETYHSHHKIAGTGLTSQSMGNETSNLTAATATIVVVEKEALGRENQRLPVYEATISRRALKTGFNEAFSGQNKAENLLEPEDLCSGLCSKTGKVNPQSMRDTTVRDTGRDEIIGDDLIRPIHSNKFQTSLP